MPSHGLHKTLAGDDQGDTLHKHLTRAGRRAHPRVLVVPAFEVSTLEEQKKALSFAGLEAAYMTGIAFGFHMWYFPQGHEATDFDR
eukprot:1424364-Amphidinium_carterae.1